MIPYEAAIALFSSKFYQIPIMAISCKIILWIRVDRDLLRTG